MPLTTNIAALPVETFDAENAQLEPWPAFDAEDIISGSPDHQGTIIYRDPSKQFSIGVWECPPAKFIVHYAGCETGHVLKGTATITIEKTGESTTISAGDHFFVPFGSVVTWEVKETVRKAYSMFETEWDDERFY